MKLFKCSLIIIGFMLIIKKGETEMYTEYVRIYLLLVKREKLCNLLISFIEWVNESKIYF